MVLSEMHRIVLEKVRDWSVTDLRNVSEEFRQKLIDLGMQEPELVTTDGPRVYITRAGLNYLNIAPR